MSFLPFITTSSLPRAFSVSPFPGSNASVYLSLPLALTFSLGLAGRFCVGLEREVLAVFFSILLACSRKAPAPNPALHGAAAVAPALWKLEVSEVAWLRYPISVTLKTRAAYGVI